MTGVCGPRGLGYQRAASVDASVTGSGRLSPDLDGDVAQRYRTDLAMTLAAFGLRGGLVTPAEVGSFALSLKADAFWARTEFEGIAVTEFRSLMSARGAPDRARRLAGGAALGGHQSLGGRKPPA